MDDIYEYLLLKGVQAVSIHGGKGKILRCIAYLHEVTDQEDRERAIKEFKEGRKDVLVATDIASKGLDFHGIQHVINFDMPKEIENYGHCFNRRLQSSYRVQSIELDAQGAQAKLD